MTNYGAFIDLGGVDGMVHKSELSWKPIATPAAVLTVGQELTVFVKSFDAEKKRISLGYKTDDTNPWYLFTSKYAVGDVASVKVVNMMPFGAFAEIIDGVDGLIHISQIAQQKIGKPADVLELGQVVDAKIIAIDEENQKISLSIKALLAPADGAVEEEVAEEASEEETEETAEEITEEKPACKGKYIVKETSSGISFRLAAGNSQVIGISEVYSSRAAMEKGVESVRKNAPIANVEDQTAETVVPATCPKFEIYNDKAGEFRFRLKAKNGEIILASEGYKTKASCENGIESVRKNAPAEIFE